MVVVAGALALAIAACGPRAPQENPQPGSDRADSPAELAGEDVRYVAMGDSYTSAPGIRGQNSSDGCLRSPRNYPAKIAEDLAVEELVDVSCSGAQTIQMHREHVTESTVKPPQLDALTEDTDLVTLSIGANDFGLFSTLVSHCASLADRDPQGAPCKKDQNESAWDSPTMQIAVIRNRVVSAVYDIQERSPQAKIVVVGYPQLVPEKGVCQARIPLAEGDYPYVRGHLEGLSKAVRAGAEFAGADYVDLLDASFGHDVCSSQPWMNGQLEKPDRALPYHPYPAEQRAVADLVLNKL